LKFILDLPMQNERTHDIKANTTIRMMPIYL
jgi:hypothetical protein